MSSQLNTFHVKRNDTLPVIVEALSSAVGPINLATATAVRFHLKEGDVVKVDAPATVVDAVAGLVSYDWDPADTDTEGKYLREWEITFPSGVLTVPNDRAGYETIVTVDLV